MKIKSFVRTFGKTIDVNSPTILTALGVAGVFSTIALTIKGTYYAVGVIDDEEFFLKRELTNREIIRIVWKLYIPTAASTVLTVAAIIGSNHISTKRVAALTSLYTLTDKALREYQDKVVELLGEKKEAKIRDSLLQDKLDSNPPKEIILTGNGQHLMYDALSGRYFRSDIEKVRKAQNDFNEILFNDMFLPLNDFYELIGLEEIEMGRAAGWDVQNGKLDIRFTSKISPDGEPCIVIEYKIEPKYI